MDVLDMARQRRNALAKEVLKLDEFIAMGDALAKGGELKLSEPEDDVAHKSNGTTDSAPIRQFPVSGSSRD